MKRSWSSDDDDLIRTGYASGWNVVQIATRLGRDVTRNMVIGRARRLGLSRRHPTKPGALGVCRVWTDDKVLCLIEGYALGIGRAEIASVLGVSVAAVSMQAKIRRLTNAAGPGGWKRRKSLLQIRA